MGLDASVRCRCWEEGNAAPFEFPDLLKLGDDGWLTLSVPSEPKYDAVGRAFFQWLDSCCPHPGTRLTSERIGNWSEMSDFREALREAGEPRFATLLQEIPTRNGGQTSPLEAQRCLSELEEFMSAPPFGRRIWIVDSADGQRLHNPMPHGGVWSYNPEKKRSFFGKWSSLHIGVDAEGIFARRHQAGKGEAEVLLHARSIEQICHDEDVIEVRDPATSNSVTTRSGIAWRETIDADGRATTTYPRFLHVEVGADTADEYQEVVGPLRTVLRTAVETGNPVLWW